MLNSIDDFASDICMLALRPSAIRKGRLIQIRVVVVYVRLMYLKHSSRDIER